MKSNSNISIATVVLGACLMLGAGHAAWAAPDAGPASAPASVSSETAPMVPPAKPGVYSETKRSAILYRLILKGHVLSSRDAVEKYLLYRAADLTLQQHYQWFTLIENRSKGDTVPVPKPDPAAPRYSFRMNFWRPVWRYKLAGSSAWSTWSPFSNAAFFTDRKDAKTVTDFEVSADIVMHKGNMDDSNPLAFEPSAVSDFLINQVSPPE
jgi:hypothetical protein